MRRAGNPAMAGNSVSGGNLGGRLDPPDKPGDDKKIKPGDDKKIKPGDDKKRTPYPAGRMISSSPSWDVARHCLQV